MTLIKKSILYLIISGFGVATFAQEITKEV